MKKNHRACRSGASLFVAAAKSEKVSLEARSTFMKVMVIVKATENSEAGKMPSAELIDAMGKYNDELIKAGLMLAGDGLHPSSKGKRIRINGHQRTVIDGPFAETKELISGYWLWQVKSMDEAVEWVRRCPAPMPGEESEIEIRPVFEMEEFGDVVTPEAYERALRQQAEIDRQAGK
jgi:hypothetical protein